MWKSAYNTKPTDLKPGDQLGSVIVAVIGHAGDWAAYETEIPGENTTCDFLSGAPIENFADYTAEQGEKISQKAAESLFPVCVNAGLKWRS